MKEAFITKKFSPASLTIIETANSILNEYERQGYDLSLRQLYYQFVARNLIANSEKSYKNLGGIISDARLAGMLDWDMIRDRGRITNFPSKWDNPAQIIKACASQFQIDRWDNQPCYVEVMVEKQALEGVLLPVCRDWRVPFMANKGYSSSSALYEAGRRFSTELGTGKEVHIIYLGDHDPSGIDMTRDVLDRAKLFSRDHEYDDTVTVHRVALNMPQIEDLRPPENPAKLTDSRANDYIARFGRSSWELDAIEPRSLAKIVKDKILSLMDAEKWDESGEIEEGMKEKLTEISQRDDLN